MTILAVALIAVTVLLSAFVQGSIGMGFTMISAPVINLVDPGVALLLEKLPTLHRPHAQSVLHWPPRAPGCSRRECRTRTMSRSPAVVRR